MLERLSRAQGLSPLERHYDYARYLFACGHTWGRDVLDVACGSGYGSELLVRYGAQSVVGVDISPDALDEARRLHAAPGVTFLEGDALDPPVSGPFGTVVSLETIEHLAEPEAALDRFARLLAEDGVLVCSTPDRSQANPGASRNDAPKNPFHLVELSRPELRRALEANFHEVELYRQLCRLPGHRPARVSDALERATAWPTRLPLPSLYLVAVCRRPRR